MSVDTAACKKAIVTYFAKGSRNMRVNLNEDLIKESNWKRVSKHGNAEKGFCRKFRNINCHTTLNVHSTEDEITEIKKALDIDDDTVQLGAQGGLLDICRELAQEDPNDIDMRDMIYSLPWDPKDGVPIVQEPYDPTEGETPGSFERLDFENMEVLDINDTSITLCAGGDWQNPQKFTSVLGKDGKLHCKEFEPGYSDGMNQDTFLYRLGIVDS